MGARPLVGSGGYTAAVLNTPQRTHHNFASMKITRIKSYSVQGESGRGYFIVRVDTDAGH